MALCSKISQNATLFPALFGKLPKKFLPLYEIQPTKPITDEQIRLLPTRKTLHWPMAYHPLRQPSRVPSPIGRERVHQAFHRIATEDSQWRERHRRATRLRSISHGAPHSHSRIEAKEDHLLELHVEVGSGGTP